MDKENQWSEINKDVTDIAKKVKSKIDEEDLVEDLKESFKKTVESTTEIFKTLINTLESTISDEEIKQDSKKVVENISSELRQVINDTKSKSVHDVSSELNYKEKSNCLSKCVSEKILLPNTLEKQQDLVKGVSPLPISKLCYSDSGVISEENRNESKLNYQEKSSCLSRCSISPGKCNLSDDNVEPGENTYKSRLSTRDECYIAVNFPGREGIIDDEKKSYCHKTSFETKHAESCVKLILN